MSHVGGSTDLGEVQPILANLLMCLWSAINRLKASNWLVGTVGIIDPRSLSFPAGTSSSLFT